MDEIIGLNVGGHIYTTSRSTLTRYPNSMLGNMFSDRGSDRLPSAKDTQGNFVIDRDGDIFRHILNFLRTSKLVLPDGYKEFDMLAEEADFYQIQELIMAIDERARARPVLRLEVREYEQRNQSSRRDPSYTKNFGVFPDWSIYGALDTLIILSRKVFENQAPNGNMLHIGWYEKTSYSAAGTYACAKQACSVEGVTHSKTAQIFTELCVLGYELESTLDAVDTVQGIDPKLTWVALKSEKTYIFRKIMSNFAN